MTARRMELAHGSAAVDPARSATAFEHPEDVVLDASLDSFPASDPPSWTGMRAGPPG